MTRAKSRSDASKKSPTARLGDQRSSSAETAHRGTRETIESIVVAIILAFLFRAFEAEAFVIPTGSMAPTLQGRHMDVKCEKCFYRYRTGASSENRDADVPGIVTSTTCPICRHRMILERPTLKWPNGRWEDNPFYDGPGNANHESFTGDRILVNKFAYELGDPQRWDVIVFKYPGNAKQNFIKRLVGLPNESILIRHGDIFIQDEEQGTYTFDENHTRGLKYRIARKPPHKIKAMLQVVDDTNHIAGDLIQVGWPSRWQQWSQDEANRSWRVAYEGQAQRFTNDGAAEGEQWLRYRHLVPRWNSRGPTPDAEPFHDWELILRGELPPDVSQRKGSLISDYYAYNDTLPYPAPFEPSRRLLEAEMSRLGMHWVGDLAIECSVDLQSDKGELLLDLVEGGVHYRCRIDVSNGEAELSIDRGKRSFLGSHEAEVAATRSAVTLLRGPGSYHVRFSNVDDELRLWIDRRLIKFDGPTTYKPSDDVLPAWNVEDPGDAEAIGIGTHAAAFEVTGLRVLRDVYYIATKSIPEFADYTRSFGDAIRVREILDDPEQWTDSGLFGSRRSCRFELKEDQFFPLGDNSPQSSDARIWEAKNRIEPYVERRLLTGKALFIYWPHSWNRPIPYSPNFQRMRFIR